MSGWAFGSALALLVSYGCDRMRKGALEVNEHLDKTEAGNLQDIAQRLKSTGGSTVYAKCEGTSSVNRTDDVLFTRAPAKKEAAIIVTKVYEINTKYVETKTTDQKGNTHKESKLIEQEDFKTEQLVGDAVFLKGFAEPGMFGGAAPRVKVARDQIPNLSEALKTVGTQFEPHVEQSDAGLASAVVGALLGPQPRLLGHKYHERIVPLGERYTLLGNFRLNGDGEIVYSKSDRRPSVLALGSEEELREAERQSASSWATGAYVFGGAGALMAGMSVWNLLSGSASSVPPGTPSV